MINLAVLLNTFAFYIKIKEVNIPHPFIIIFSPLS